MGLPEDLTFNWQDVSRAICDDLRDSQGNSRGLRQMGGGARLQSIELTASRTLPGRRAVLACSHFCLSLSTLSRLHPDRPLLFLKYKSAHSGRKHRMI